MSLYRKFLKFIAGSVYKQISLFDRANKDILSNIELINYKLDVLKTELISSGILNNAKFTFSLKNSFEVEKIILESEKKYNTYSQFKEDLIVKFIFDSLNIANPSFIDIGAYHPKSLSNTALLYETGSRGINIEPNAELFKEFIKTRIEDINLNIGVHSKNGELEYYFIKDKPTYNTFSKEQIKRLSVGRRKVKKVVKLQVKRVNSIIQEHFNGKFPDFLTIDVEGLDFTILNDIDFSLVCPKVICVEVDFHNEGGKNLMIYQLLFSNKYFLYTNIGPNALFVKYEFFDQLNN